MTPPEGGAKPTTSRRADRFEALAAFVSAVLVYTGLSFLLTSAAWIDPAQRWPGGCCDQQLMIWMLRWIPTVIQHGGDPLFTTQMNAPAGVNLMWNTSIPAVALLLTPVTIVMGPVVAYNVALVLALVTSGLAAWLAARHYVAGVVAPLVAGAVYAFSSYSVGHATVHLNLTVAFAPPLMLILLDELLVRRRRNAIGLGVAIGALAALQLYVFEEVLATLAIAATVLAFVLVVAVRERERIREGVVRVATAAAPAALTFGVLAAWPLSVQFLGPRRIQSPVQDVSSFSTDLMNLVLPTPNTLLAPGPLMELTRHFSSLYHEATAYVGVPLLVVLVVLVVTRWHDLRVRVAGLTALLLFILSLGPVLHVATIDTGIPMPWWPLAHLPLIEHAIPGRVTMYLFLAVAVLVAVAVEQLRRMPLARGAAGLAVLAVALAVTAPRPMNDWQSPTPAWFQGDGPSRLGPDALVLFAPHFANGAGAAPMQWTAVAGNEPRMWQGYAYVPRDDGRPGYGPPGNDLTRMMVEIQDNGTPLLARGVDRQRAIGDLVDNGITHVIVGPLKHRAEMVAFFTDLFAGPPEELEGVELWDVRSIR
ncbi:MAG TPA: hypothetical protein VGK16_08290 [Candidatus Limnocylindrales bacterium]